MFYKKTQPLCRGTLKYSYLQVYIIHEGRWIFISKHTVLPSMQEVYKTWELGKLYNKLPGYIKEIESYKTFKKELKSFLLLHTFHSVEEYVASCVQY
jgi:hypothetical protein